MQTYLWDCGVFWVVWCLFRAEGPNQRVGVNSLDFVDGDCFLNSDKKHLEQNDLCTPEPPLGSQTR